MAIRVTLAVEMAKRGMRSRDLARALGITEANMSLLRNGKVRGLRLETLGALCRILECQPGDLLVHERDEAGAAVQAKDLTRR